MNWFEIIIYCGVIPFIVSFGFGVLMNRYDPYLKYLKELNEKDKEFLRKNNYLK